MEVLPVLDSVYLEVVVVVVVVVGVVVVVVVVVSIRQSINLNYTAILPACFALLWSILKF